MPKVWRLHSANAGPMVLPVLQNLRLIHEKSLEARFFPKWNGLKQCANFPPKYKWDVGKGWV